VLHTRGVSVVAVDSTEPDLDHGEIGRGRYPWIEEQFSYPAALRIFVLHHHLLPVPGTGRERNVVYDAGDAIECLQRARVDLVLSGHKHVPYAWRLEDMFIVNTGTVSTTRLRGNGRPCYNVIEPLRRRRRHRSRTRECGTDRCAHRGMLGLDVDQLAVRTPVRDELRIALDDRRLRRDGIRGNDVRIDLAHRVRDRLAAGEQKQLAHSATIAIASSGQTSAHSSQPLQTS